MEYTYEELEELYYNGEIDVFEMLKALDECYIVTRSR